MLLSLTTLFMCGLGIGVLFGWLKWGRVTPQAGNINPNYPGRYGNWEPHAKLYEGGKHRRYELLFAVNGGAFALGKLFIEQHTASESFLKSLTLNQAGIGMILFTATMGYKQRMLERLHRSDENLVST